MSTVIKFVKYPELGTICCTPNDFHRITETLRKFWLLLTAGLRCHRVTQKLFQQSSDPRSFHSSSPLNVRFVKLSTVAVFPGLEGSHGA